jgi:hypothetical protein
MPIETQKANLIKAFKKYNQDYFNENPNDDPDNYIGDITDSIDSTCSFSENIGNLEGMEFKNKSGASINFNFRKPRGNDIDRYFEGSEELYTDVKDPFHCVQTINLLKSKSTNSRDESKVYEYGEIRLTLPKEHVGKKAYVEVKLLGDDVGKHPRLINIDETMYYKCTNCKAINEVFFDYDRKLWLEVWGNTPRGLRFEYLCPKCEKVGDMVRVLSLSDDSIQW